VNPLQGPPSPIQVGCALGSAGYARTALSRHPSPTPGAPRVRPYGPQRRPRSLALPPPQEIRGEDVNLSMVQVKPDGCPSTPSPACLSDPPHARARGRKCGLPDDRGDSVEPRENWPEPQVAGVTSSALRARGRLEVGASPVTNEHHTSNLTANSQPTTVGHGPMRERLTTTTSAVSALRLARVAGRRADSSYCSNAGRQRAHRARTASKLTRRKTRLAPDRSSSAGQMA
jgi:hypothetical protein